MVNIRMLAIKITKMLETGYLFWFRTVDGISKLCLQTAIAMDQKSFELFHLNHYIRDPNISLTFIEQWFIK